MECCCGNCKYHKPIAEDTFICDNEESEGYALETLYNDYCDCYEERED